MFQLKIVEVGDAHWRLKANCLNSDPALFFPKSRLSPEYAVAIKICQGCPVLSQCLNTALQSRETTGVWGGVLFRPNGEQYEAR